MTDNNNAVDLFADFATNAKKEQEGVYVPYRNDVSFLIARTGNKAYRKLFTQQLKKNKRLLDSDNEASEAKAEEIMIDLMARTVLLGWTGQVTFQGKPMTYTVENAKVLLAVEGFRTWVHAQAEDISAYKAVQDEDDVKN